MRRVIVPVCAALMLAATLTTPASATTWVTKQKSDYRGSAACGNGNAISVDSWVRWSQNPDVGDPYEIDYDALKNDHYDIRIYVTGPSDLNSVEVDVKKLQADGSGYVDHWSQTRSFGAGGADSIETWDVNFGWTNVNDNRKPYLRIQANFSDGGCISKTAYENTWIP